MALHGNRAQIVLTSAPSVSMTNQALTNSGDHTTYNMTGTPTRRYWDRTATFTFETSVDGTNWTPATPVSVRYINGQVTFGSAIGGTHQARVASGKYWPYSTLAQAREWSPDVSRSIHEDTVMTTTSSPVRYRTFKPGLLEGSFSLNGWLVDDTYLNLITSTTPLIAGLVIDATTGARLDCECMLTSQGIEVAVDDLIGEELEFKITGEVYLTP